METAHMMEAKIGQLQRRKKSHRHRRNHPVKVAKDAPNRWPHCFAAKSTSREFFERVMSSKHNCEDRSDLIIPYRSVIGFYRQEENYLADLRSQHNTCACVADARYLIGRNGRGRHAE
jgi:hypothetical protein